MKAIDEGYKAHSEHKVRGANPHLIHAINWDAGWIRRQKEELKKSGRETDASRINNFFKWIGSYADDH